MGEERVAGAGVSPGCAQQGDTERRHLLGVKITPCPPGTITSGWAPCPLAALFPETPPMGSLNYYNFFRGFFWSFLDKMSDDMSLSRLFNK